MTGRRPHYRGGGPSAYPLPTGRVPALARREQAHGQGHVGFTASLDEFIAGPGHDMSWLGASGADPLEPEVMESLAAAVGVIISVRRGYDAAREQAEERDELTAEAYGGAWSGTEFILTHHPEQLADDPAIVPLNCGIDEAIRRAQAIAGDLDVQIISADIARQALEEGLLDDMQMFLAPVFLGDGTRVFDVPGGRFVRWELVGRIGAGTSSGWRYRPAEHTA